MCMYRCNSIDSISCYNNQSLRSISGVFPNLSQASSSCTHFVLPIFSGKFGFVSNQVCNSFSCPSTSSSLLVVILFPLLFLFVSQDLCGSSMRTTSISLNNWAQATHSICPNPRRSKLIKPSKLICSIQAYANTRTHTNIFIPDHTYEANYITYIHISRIHKHTRVAWPTKFVLSEPISVLIDLQVHMSLMLVTSAKPKAHRSQIHSFRLIQCILSADISWVQGILPSVTRSTLDFQLVILLLLLLIEFCRLFRWHQIAWQGESVRAAC